MLTRICTLACVVWLEVIRRKDVYVLLVLLTAVLLAVVSLDIFGLGGAIAYVKDIGLLGAWIFGWVLAIHVAARELPQEEDRGTIYPLLAKPVTRFQLLAGKCLGSWSIVCFASLVFYLLILLVVCMKGAGFEPVTLVQGYLLHSAALGILSAVAVLFSTRMNHDAAAAVSYVLTGAAFLVVPRIPVMLTHEKGFASVALNVLYHLLPHFELFDMRQRIVHGYPPIGWGVFCGIMAYGLVLILLFVLLAWLWYRKKRFSRSNLV